ncbi:MAG: translocation/assembly module TamB [Prochloron sp. SP5CPC1]|nr:translocation/assembly module TamB [Candidatus Paraprochloron terpiosi SP5CPC1]
MEIKGEQKDRIFNIQTNQFPLESIKELLLLSKLPLNPAIAIANQAFPGKISAKIGVDLDSFGTGLPVFNAEAEIIDGEIQNILALAQIFEFSDLLRGFSTPTYGTSEELYSEEGTDPDSALLSVGFPEESREPISILTQLRRFSAIKALLKQQRRQRQEASPLPDLITLEGSFNSKLVVSKAADSPLVTEFEFNGGSEEKPWQWGSYGANLVTLQGKFENGLLTLSPAKIETIDGMSVEVSGSLNNNQVISSTVKIQNLSITNISDFVDLPPVIDRGTIDLDAIISGSLDNLNLGGSVKLQNATVQQTTIPLVEGSINYNKGTLNLSAGSNFAQDQRPTAPETVGKDEKSCQSTDLVTMDLKLPYQLPNAKSKPDNDEFSLSMSVHNKGMELLNIGTKGQVRWLGGTGCVELAVIGKLEQEESGLRLLDLRLDDTVDVYNTATFENATVAIQALPNAPLTEINGNISFELDKIRVEKLAGKFSGGEVLVTGDLPLLEPITQDNPLTVTLEQLKLNLKGLYKGGVGGNILITGTALEPKIAGEVDLFNGTVFLEEQTTPVISSSDTQEEGWFEFQDLQLKLGNNITVAKPPILNFLATGDLSLFGTLETPRLSGDVILKRGQVNLFTTQFRLTRGYNHRARFSPNLGLDPILDVRLQTSTTEKTRKAISTDSLSAEVSVSDIPGLDISSLQTIRIEAEVFGPASKLTENLELTSSPSRSETEIVNLLGGGFIDTLLGEDTTLGLANIAGSALAGSAFFNNIQNTIGNTLGVSEFRVFPSLITDDENRPSALGVGAEVSVDIAIAKQPPLASQFSFSVLKIINSPQPFQYGIRYRINDSILFRGSTDLSGDDRGIIEYEFKF